MEAGVRDGARDGTPVVRVAVYDVAARAVAERQVAVAQRRLHRIALDTEEEQVGRIAPEPTLEPVGPERERIDDLIGEERSEEHTFELQSLMRNSYAVFCLKKRKL